jgi:flagellar biosynthesis regulator FlaF
MRSAGAAITAVLLLALCPVAQAADSDVWAAYTGHDRQLERAFAAFNKAIDQWNHAHGRRVRANRAIIKADQKMNRVFKAIIHDLRSQEASTDAGARAKSLAISGFRRWTYANVCQIRTARAQIRGDSVARRRWARRGLKAFKRAERDIDRADAAFKQAGYQHG